MPLEIKGKYILTYLIRAFFEIVYLKETFFQKWCRSNKIFTRDVGDQRVNFVTNNDNNLQIFRSKREKTFYLCVYIKNSFYEYKNK